MSLITLDLQRQLRLLIVLSLLICGHAEACVRWYVRRRRRSCFLDHGLLRVIDRLLAHDDLADHECDVLAFLTGGVSTFSWRLWERLSARDSI